MGDYCMRSVYLSKEQKKWIEQLEQAGLGWKVIVNLGINAGLKWIEQKKEAKNG